MKILTSNPNIIHIGNGKMLNFESYGGKKPHQIFTECDFDRIYSVNSESYRERQLGMYSAFQPFIAQYKNTGWNIVPAINDLINIYKRPTYIQMMDALTNCDLTTCDDGIRGIGKFKESLKAFLGTNNIVVAFNTENTNLFNICINSIQNLNNIDNVNPIDASFTAEGNVKFLHAADIVVTVFVGPKQLKELVQAYIVSDKTKKQFDAGIVEFTTLHKALSDIFAAALITALIGETYREVRVNQYNTIMNVVKFGIEQNLQGTFTISAGGAWESGKYKEFFEMLRNAYDERLHAFLIKGEQTVGWVSPNFMKFANSFDTFRTWGSNDQTINPLLLMQAATELPNNEFGAFLAQYEIPREFNGFTRISNLSYKSQGNIKNSSVTDAVRSIIALARVIPFIYYTTYLNNNGMDFKTTETIIAEINKALETAYYLTTDNAVNSIQKVINRIKDYEIQFKSSFKNPINTSRDYIQFMFEFLRKTKYD